MKTLILSTLCLLISMNAFSSSYVCEARQKGTRYVERVFSKIQESNKNYLFLIGHGTEGMILNFKSNSGDESTFESEKFKIVVNF